MKTLRNVYLLLIASIITITGSCSDNIVVKNDLLQIDSLFMTKEITKIELDLINKNILKLCLTGHYPQKEMIKSQKYIISLDSLKELELYYMNLDSLKLPKYVENLKIEQCKLSINLLKSMNQQRLKKLDIVYKYGRELIKLSDIPQNITNLYIYGAKVDFKSKGRSIKLKKLYLIICELDISDVSNIEIDTLIVDLDRTININTSLLQEKFPRTSIFYSPDSTMKKR